LLEIARVRHCSGMEPNGSNDAPGLIDAGRLALGAFDWIGSVAVAVPGGLGWFDGDDVADDLYSGTAGVLLSCTEAVECGFALDDIGAGATARLVYLAGRGPDSPTMPDDGLFSGWAGVAVALRTWSRVTDDTGAGVAAGQLTSDIAERILVAPLGPDRCTDIISGDAGILLALLRDDSEVAADAAELLANSLVARAEPAPVGVHWRTSPGYPRLMPGFSHGTAGVAYALALAGHRMGRNDLLESAIQGAAALLDIGDKPGGWAVPLTLPRHDEGPAVNFGWCHGPTGAVRLFLALNDIDPQPRWRRAIEACLQALRDSQLPARLYPGYWDNLGRCCGTAGVGHLLLERYQVTTDTAFLDWADDLVADVASRALITPAGISWSNTEHTRSPADLAPEPGFMQGAAGIASWLAAVDALHRR
jgi:lantibiotic modifying enzyme